MKTRRPTQVTMHPAVGWAVLRSNELRERAVTIRWQRGHRKAYVLTGERIGDHGTARLLDEVPVDRNGWTDLAEVRLAGQNWLHQHLAKAGAR